MIIKIWSALKRLLVLVSAQWFIQSVLVISPSPSVQEAFTYWIQASPWSLLPFLGTCACTRFVANIESTTIWHQSSCLSAILLQSVLLIMSCSSVFMSFCRSPTVCLTHYVLFFSLHVYLPFSFRLSYSLCPVLQSSCLSAILLQSVLLIICPVLESSCLSAISYSLSYSLCPILQALDTCDPLSAKVSLATVFLL